eukprot:10451087-Alexandrium_andersonii.AAC.1
MQRAIADACCRRPKPEAKLRLGRRQGNQREGGERQEPKAARSGVKLIFLCRPWGHRFCCER